MAMDRVEERYSQMSIGELFVIERSVILFYTFILQRVYWFQFSTQKDVFGD